MSSYLNFFLRVNDKFAPIGCFSRNTEMYQQFKWLPYEKMRALKDSSLSAMIKDIEEKILECTKERKDCEDDIERILKSNNNLEDKFDYIDAYLKPAIKEINEGMEELVKAKHYLLALEEMIDTFRYAESNLENDFNHYVYAGIEVCGNMDEVED